MDNPSPQIGFNDHGTRAPIASLFDITAEEQRMRSIDTQLKKISLFASKARDSVQTNPQFPYFEENLCIFYLQYRLQDGHFRHP